MVAWQQLDAAKADRAAAQLMDALTLARTAAITTGDPHALIFEENDERLDQVLIARLNAESGNWQLEEKSVRFPDGTCILPVTSSFTDAPKGWVPFAVSDSEVPVRRLIFGSEGGVEQPVNPKHLRFYIGGLEDLSAVPLEESTHLPWIEVGPRTGVSTFHRPTAKGSDSP